MTTAGYDGNQERFEVKATAESHFSWLRTRLSIERTLMSWVRTAVSLIGFGFTIVQFFNRMQDLSTATTPRFSNAPWFLGLALIFCGVLALVISIFQYKWTLHYLRSGSFAAIAGFSEAGKQTPIIAVAIALCFIGIIAFFAVLLHFV